MSFIVTRAIMAIMSLATAGSSLFLMKKIQDEHQEEKAHKEFQQYEDKIIPLLSTIARNDSLKFQTLLQDIDLSRMPQPINTVSPLRFALERNDYEKATMLLKMNYPATLEDRELAYTVQNREHDATQKKEAGIFIQFLEHHLQEHGILPYRPIYRASNSDDDDSPSSTPTSPVVSPDDKHTMRMKRLFEQLNSKEDKMHKAISHLENDKVKAFLEEQANPHEEINQSSALDIAIARGNDQAILMLLERGVRPTIQSLERAELYNTVFRHGEDDRKMTKQEELDEANRRLHIIGILSEIVCAAEPLRGPIPRFSKFKPVKSPEPSANPPTPASLPPIPMPLKPKQQTLKVAKTNSVMHVAKARPTQLAPLDHAPKESAIDLLDKSTDSQSKTNKK